MTENSADWCVVKINQWKLASTEIPAYYFKV